MRGILIGIAVAAISAAISATPAGAIDYAKSGDIIPPANYRDWVFLTSSLDLNYNEPVPGAAAPAKSQLDNVFVNPEAYKVYMKTGTWPDKTVMVKENRVAAPSADEIGKSGKVQEGIISIELHVKDKKRYPGDGWAFFFSNGKTPTARYVARPASCYTCHEEHGKVDTTFVQFYPTLVDVAKAHKTFKGD